MATNDTCCTIVPYFEVQPAHLDDFKALCERFVAKTEEEPDCLYYGFAFDGHAAHCREGYVNAAGLLAHLRERRSATRRGVQDLRDYPSRGARPGIRARQASRAAGRPQPAVLHIGVRVPPVAARAAGRACGLTSSRHAPAAVRSSSRFVAVPSLLNSSNESGSCSRLVRERRRAAPERVLQEAMPRKSASARLTASMSASSRRPKMEPNL